MGHEHVADIVARLLSRTINNLTDHDDRPSRYRFHCIRKTSRPTPVVSARCGLHQHFHLRRRAHYIHTHRGTFINYPIHGTTSAPASLFVFPLGKIGQEGTVAAAVSSQLAAGLFLF